MGTWRCWSAEKCWRPDNHCKENPNNIGVMGINPGMNVNLVKGLTSLANLF
jgi:hypothetical protein